MVFFGALLIIVLIVSLFRALFRYCLLRVSMCVVMSGVPESGVSILLGADRFNCRHVRISFL